MPRLPQPPLPAALRSLLRPEEHVVTVSTSTRLIRVFAAGAIHRARWNSFRYTGPLSQGKFDPHPLSPDRRPASSPSHGVLYASLSVRTSIAEAFGVTSTVDRTARSPHLVVFRPRRSLALLDLQGVWPATVGAAREISSGPKVLTQAWARTIRDAYPDLDGVWYRSSLDAGGPVLCLWDPPAGSALPDAPEVLMPLDYLGLDVPLTRICEELNYALVGGEGAKRG